MPLSLNEIRKRAIAFSLEWKEQKSEIEEYQTFWNAFFEIFGMSRRRVATFQKPAIKTDGGKGRIDLFWSTMLIVEHKSAGADLNKANLQAIDYFAGLDETELPRYIIVSDYQRFRVYDLESGVETYREFKLIDLSKNIDLFGFISGYKPVSYEEEDPVNIKAAELMAKLHDSLKENGYEGHNLEILLVRLMFCLFADDTGIFQKDRFTYFIDKKTAIDGSDIGSKLIYLFEILNTPEEKRQKNIDEEINPFPYIDGELFEEKINTPSFDSGSRNILLQCSHFDWSKVSPPVFGSLFQSVMDQEKRHEIGGHYTSEKNILKLITPLFIDELNDEFETHKNNKRYLQDLLKKIGEIRILDPACGCGNFLIIAYRELRILQIKIRSQIVKLEGKSSQTRLSPLFDEDLNVDCMYGIEIMEFPARIAKVGLWLVDHLVNIKLSEAFGVDFRRLPLTKTANIFIKNALREDWGKLMPLEKISYIIGNPPFVSKQDRTEEQQEDMELVCKSLPNHNLLDYVACWYIKTADYILSSNVKVGFVSTNSITQGEQVGILGDYLTNQKGIKINFAHRTFKWTSDARGKAHVYVVIIGFSMTDDKDKYLFDYEKPDSEPARLKVKNINLYLIDYENIYVFNRAKPISNVPEIRFGSMPNDGGNLIFDEAEKNDFLKKEPNAKSFVKPLISAEEYLHNGKRWCLWLKDITPAELNSLKYVKERVMKVKEYRLASKREATRKLAESPRLFGEIRQPDSSYILVPLTTSENRKYIPLSFFSKDYVVNNTCSIIPNATLYHFGILMSAMHMAWVNQVCGRLKSDYRYSNNLVYNNYPWPKDISSENMKKVEIAAKDIIETRKKYPESSLSELYDPLLMPKELLLAHKKLDSAADKCYRSASFKTDLERLRLLFDLYKAAISQNNAP